MSQMEYTETFLNEQRRFLEDLIAFREPLEKLQRRDKLGIIWDARPENLYLATVTRKDVISVLKRFLERELTQSDVYKWAEELVSRNMVNKEANYIQPIINALHEISTDYDHGRLFTPKRAQELIAELESAQFDPEDI